jgi:hypothetical protein
MFILMLIDAIGFVVGGGSYDGGFENDEYSSQRGYVMLSSKCFNMSKATF